MLYEYLFFFAKAITIVIAVLVVLLGIVAIIGKGKLRPKEFLQVKNLNKEYEKLQHTLREEILEKSAFKELTKKEAKQKKAAAKAAEQGEQKQRIFVVNFHGDIRASAVTKLREEITAILTVAKETDEVVVRLESAGGMVHAYGLAASQLQRLRRHNIPLTAIIDKVAASGGYMMAAVANKIFAAPFAVVGSIGVIAQIPNFHRLLKKNDIEFEQVMAGQYKRTLTLFGENTEQGREKFQEEINEAHELFKSFLLENRNLNIEKVATGEHWYGSRALQLQLIDGIHTSDDYLLQASKEKDVYEVTYQTKKTFVEKLSSNAQQGYQSLLETFTKNSSNPLL
jgi:serine protease SohB